MQGPLRWEEHPEKVDWAESSLELSVSEAKGSELGTGLGIGLGESPGLGTELGTELGDSSGLGTDLGKTLGLGTELGTDLGEPTLLGDRDQGKRYKRLHCLCLVTGFVGRSRNRRSRTCFR